VTGIDVLTTAFIESNIFGPADPIPPEDMAFALNKVNRLLDNWNAKRRAVYCDVFTTFTLVPSLSPHTIGPTGTFVTPQRPVSIESASLVVSAGLLQDIAVHQDAAWYASVSTPGVTGPLPTDVYYEKNWPLGKLYFWPVPTSAKQVELQSRVVLAALTLAGTFSFPPGYEDAITLTLGEALADAYPGSTAPAGLSRAAAAARTTIFGNNDETPALATRDSGMPGGSGGSSYNWMTGRNE